MLPEHLAGLPFCDLVEWLYRTSNFVLIGASLTNPPISLHGDTAFPDLSQTLPAVTATSITPCMPGMVTGCRHCALPAAVHKPLWQNMPMRAPLFIHLLRGIICNGLRSLFNR